MQDSEDQEVTPRPWRADQMARKIPAGDERVLFFGHPPAVDVRVISEPNYQHAVRCVNSVAAEHQGKRPKDRKAAMLALVSKEMAKQDEQWGWPRPAEFLKDDDVPESDGIHLDGHGLTSCLVEAFGAIEDRSRALFSDGRPCWMAILGEELGEVAREEDPQKRIAELKQAATVIISWMQAIEEEEAKKASK